jgi:hypothetical protein
MIDLSVWTGKNMRSGVCRCANSYLARKFGVSSRTIQRWKLELLSTQKLLTKERPMANTWPMTIYEFPAITDLHVPIPDNSETEDGFFPEDEMDRGTNRRRAERTTRDSANGQWHSKTGVQGSKMPKRPNGAVFAEMPAIVDVERQNCPTSPDKIVRPPRTKLSDPGGQPCPASRDTSVAPRATELSGVAGQNCPPWPDTSVAQGATQLADIGETQVGRLETLKNYLSVQRGPGAPSDNGKTPAKSPLNALEREKEKDFLQQVEKTLGQWNTNWARDEMANSGAWWRLRYREKRELIYSVLGEVGCMITEGRIQGNPGSCAVDLWQRWNDGKAESPPKPKATRAAAKPAPAKPKPVAMNAARRAALFAQARKEAKV